LIRVFTHITPAEAAILTSDRAEQRRHKKESIDAIVRKAKRLVGVSIKDPVQVDEFIKKNYKQVIFAIQYAKLRRQLTRKKKQAVRFGKGHT
jgi:hypothetical protein